MSAGARQHSGHFPPLRFMLLSAAPSEARPVNDETEPKADAARVVLLIQGPFSYFFTYLAAAIIDQL